jgi:hypothetical protein
MAIPDLILAELNTPSGQTGPLSAAYRRAIEGVAHGVLGAAFCAPFGWWGIVAGVAVAAVYWAAKERRDLRRGGRVWDGLEDTAPGGGPR